MKFGITKSVTSATEEAFDLREAIETSLDLLRTTTAEKNLDMVYEMAPDVPEVIRVEELVAALMRVKG